MLESWNFTFFFCHHSTDDFLTDFCVEIIANTLQWLAGWLLGVYVCRWLVACQLIWIPITFSIELIGSSAFSLFLVNIKFIYKTQTLSAAFAGCPFWKSFSSSLSPLEHLSSRYLIKDADLAFPPLLHFLESALFFFIVLMFTWSFILCLFTLKCCEVRDFVLVCLVCGNILSPGQFRTQN